MDRLLAPDRLAIETVIATSKPIPNRGAMATRLRGNPSKKFFRFQWPPNELNFAAHARLPLAHERRSWTIWFIWTRRHVQHSRKLNAQRAL
jgi:hypothetical protein